MCFLADLTGIAVDQLQVVQNLVQKTDLTGEEGCEEIWNH